MLLSHDQVRDLRGVDSIMPCFIPDLSGKAFSNKRQVKHELSYLLSDQGLRWSNRVDLDFSIFPDLITW